MHNRHSQKYGMDAIQRRLQGIQHPNSKVGILGRGKNVYLGGSSTPNRGSSLNVGRPVGSKDKLPTRSSVSRRLRRR